MEKILESTKKLLGVPSDYEEFDPDILMHINSAFVALSQMGIGPDTGFIADNSTTWTDFTNDQSAINILKTYIAYKVRLGWDPPSNGVHIEALKKQIDEKEFYLRTLVDWGGAHVV